MSGVNGWHHQNSVMSFLALALSKYFQLLGVAGDSASRKRPEPSEADGFGPSCEYISLQQCSSRGRLFKHSQILVFLNMVNSRWNFSLTLCDSHYLMFGALRIQNDSCSPLLDPISYSLSCHLDYLKNLPLLYFLVWLFSFSREFRVKKCCEGDVFYRVLWQKTRKIESLSKVYWNWRLPQFVPIKSSGAVNYAST